MTEQTQTDNVFKVDGVKVTIVSYEEFTDSEFIPPATFYVMDSLQQYKFIHTSSREVATKIVYEIYGHNRYSIKASKLQKSTGTVTAVGHQTRRGQRK